MTATAMRAPVRVAVTAALVLAAATGCSSAKHAGSTTSTSTRATAPPRTTTTVKLVTPPTVADKAISPVVWAGAYCRAVAPLGPLANPTDLDTPQAGTRLAARMRAAVVPVSTAVLALAPLGYPNVRGGREYAQWTLLNAAQAPSLVRGPRANPVQLDLLTGSFLQASAGRVIIALFQSQPMTPAVQATANAMPAYNKQAPDCKGLA